MQTKQIQKQMLSTIWLRLAENISQDYLEFFLITSQAAGLEESLGRAFGMGKSTLAVWMTYRAWAYHKGLLDISEDPEGNITLIDRATEQQRIELMLHVVRNFCVWRLDRLCELISSLADNFAPAILWDDAQDTAPALQHVPEDVVEKIGYLTRVRQRVANIIITAPAMGEIAKPLRRCVTWEIIVPQRGTYEVQFLLKRRDFYKPTEDRMRMWYETTGKFDPLPEIVDAEYKRLRDQQLNEAPKSRKRR